MTTSTTFEDVLAFLRSATPDEVQVVENACRTRRQHEAAIRMRTFRNGQRVRISGNVQKKYQGRYGTVRDVKTKRIKVELDARIFDSAIFLHCLPEHLTIVKEGEPGFQGGSVVGPVVQPMPVGPTRTFMNGERVRIADPSHGRWDQIEGIVRKCNEKTISIETDAGKVRVPPDFLVKIVD